MFRITQVFPDSSLPSQAALERVQEILRTQMPYLPESDIVKLPDQLRSPVEHRFRTLLFVADDGRGRIDGFVTLLHAADLNFCFIEFLATTRHSRGIGGALYRRAREEARSLGCLGLFLESAADSKELCSDPKIRKQNTSRIKFYEELGGRVISGTAYETPVDAESTTAPYLVFDNLSGDELRPAMAQAIVRAILLRKYFNICSSDYIDTVVRSFADDPIQVRPVKAKKTNTPKLSSETLIPLVVNEKHDIHHIRERGYVESPVRIKAIMKGLDSTGLFQTIPAESFSESHILEVHDEGMVEYIKAASASLKDGDPAIYPYVFPIRNADRKPKKLSKRAGYYCIDTFTPIHSNVFDAAKGAVNCALTACQPILKGQSCSYALVRPPGHHAERSVFGGFCYFNSAAIAANHLSKQGRVALLDIDYHHGNGAQDIFYERSDVLTVSIHRDPSEQYPYFTGYADELGEGEGKDFNVNYALETAVEGARYREVLKEALERIRQFDARFLVVSFGLDVAKGDPTGTWLLSPDDFRQNGLLIGQMGLPTVIVQEGGYYVRKLGSNARNFFQGIAESGLLNKVRVPSSTR
jgi:acetoin utilization deacetylase AcuC-like enzyme/GNAT superfamily N-acetyltransferase